MKTIDALQTAQTLMASFAERTRLTSAVFPPQRYLWTDAFALCNLLELLRRTGDETYGRLALRLIEQVHDTLGRHRRDDPRTGWISGLDDAEGRLHPTLGGLRIGKELRERGPDEPLDEETEWDRDGQYFHYLTKWMHALARAAQTSGRETCLRWAVELARTSHARFTFTPPNGGHRRMHWKMSVDLSRPLVPSMGQHDPLDGWLTFSELQLATARASGSAELPSLEDEIADLRSMCSGSDWSTDDALGLGSLLSDAHRVALLILAGGLAESDLCERLLHAAANGLNALARSGRLEGPASRRLAFRELGLSIGLKALPRMQALLEQAPARRALGNGVAPLLADLARYTLVGEGIDAFWLHPESQASPFWIAHLDINTVMLATSLAPDGLLAL